MKRLLTFLTLFLMLGGVASANIYDCKFEFASIIIKIDPLKQRLLSTVDPKTGKFLADDEVLVNKPVFISTITVLPNDTFISFPPINKGSYNGYVYQYTKPGDNNKFKAFYMESFSRQNLVQIVIHMWETNLPAFFYSPELPDKTFIGNCR
jgi:hypothetical protein